MNKITIRQKKISLIADNNNFKNLVVPNIFFNTNKKILALQNIECFFSVEL